MLAEGQILQIHPVVTRFANFEVSGFGVTIGGDILRLSPRQPVDPHEWSPRCATAGPVMGWRPPAAYAAGFTFWFSRNRFCGS